MNVTMREKLADLGSALIEAFESGAKPNIYMDIACAAYQAAEHPGFDKEDKAEYVLFAHQAMRLALSVLEGDLAMLGINPSASGQCEKPPNSGGGAHHRPAAEW